MSDLPETVTLEWLGQKLLEMQQEQRASNERLDQFEHRLQHIEAYLFRDDARQRDREKRLYAASDALLKCLPTDSVR